MTIFTPRINPPLSLLPWSANYINGLTRKHRTEFTRYCIGSAIIAFAETGIFYHMLPIISSLSFIPHTIIVCTLAFSFATVLISCASATAQSYKNYIYFKEFQNQENPTNKVSDEEFIKSEWSANLSYFVVPKYKFFETQRILDQRINELISVKAANVSFEEKIRIKEQVLKNIQETGIINRRKLEHCPLTDPITLYTELSEPKIIRINNNKIAQVIPPKTTPFSKIAFRNFVETIIENETSFARTK